MKEIAQSRGTQVDKQRAENKCLFLGFVTPPWKQTSSFILIVLVLIALQRLSLFKQKEKFKKFTLFCHLILHFWQ